MGLGEGVDGQRPTDRTIGHGSMPRPEGFLLGHGVLTAEDRLRKTGVLVWVKQVHECTPGGDNHLSQGWRG